MKKILTLIAILALPVCVYSATYGRTTYGKTSVIIEEQDGDPLKRVVVIKVPNGTLIDEGSGVITIEYATLANLAEIAIDTTALQALSDILGISTESLRVQLVAVAVDTTTLELTKVDRAGDTMTGNLNVPKIGISTAANFIGLFQVGDGTFTIIENGFIGIGEDDPGSLLTLKGVIDTEPILRIKAIGIPNEAHIIIETDTQAWGFHVEGGDDTFRLHDETSPTKTFPIIVQADTPTNTLFLKSNGNIGIGKNNPTSTFDIEGTLSVSGVITGDGSGITGVTGASHADSANCPAGNFPLGVDGIGAVQNCTDAATQAELDTHSGISSVHHTATVSSDIDHDSITGVSTSDHHTLFVLSDDIVTTAKINDDAVTSEKILNNSVNSDDLRTDSVGSDEIQTDAVGSDEIAANAVDTSEINTGAVTTPKLASDAVTNPKIITGAIDARTIATNAVGSDEIAADAVGTSEIATNGVDTDELAASAVETAKINDAAVTTPKLASGSVDSEKVLDNSLTDDDLAMNSVGTSEIQTGAVTTAQLGADAVTGVKIINGAITTNKLSDGSVTTPKLADDSVTRDKIAADSCTDGQILKLSGTEWTCVDDSGASISGIIIWQMTSSGTLTAEEFSWTVDNSVPQRITISVKHGGSNQQIWLRFNGDTTGDKHKFGSHIIQTQSFNACKLTGTTSVGSTANNRLLEYKFITNPHPDSNQKASAVWEGGFKNTTGGAVANPGFCDYLGDGSTEVTSAALIGSVGNLSLTGNFYIEEFKALP